MILFWIFYLLPQPVLTQSQPHNHESITLLVDKPAALNSLYRSGITPTRPAFFGFPKYFLGSLTGVVVYGTRSNRNGCMPFDTDKSDKPWPKTNVILMVDRGNCTFVTKVKNAEAAGASACIVVDNKDEEFLPYMADDGNGGDIEIPSLFIQKKAGTNIKKYLKDTQVILQLNWRMPKPDDRVEWEFWHVPDDTPSKKFIQSFQKVAESLGKRVMFSPHYFIFDGEEYGCRRNGSNKCGNDCTNKGRYCYITSRFRYSTLIDPKVTGAAIVEESIRQLCLWKVVNQTQYEPQWWDYVLKFEEECWEPDRETRKTCSRMLIGKIFPSSIQMSSTECETASGGYGQDLDSDNTIAQSEIDLHHSKHIRFIPTIRVNEVVYRGSLKCPAPAIRSKCGVLATICAGFIDGTLPSDCDKCGIERVMDACGQCENPNSSAFNHSCLGCDGIPNSGATLDACSVCKGPGRDACGHCFPVGDDKRIEDVSKCPGAASGIKSSVVVVIVLLAVLAVGIGVYVYLRRQKIAMREDVDSLLKQYLPIDAATNGRDSDNGNIMIQPMLEENPETIRVGPR